MMMPEPCKDCGKLLLHYAKGLCERCWRRRYQRERMRRLRAERKAEAARKASS